jgi:hypothetical protein
MRFMVQSTALYAPPCVQTADELAKQVGKSVSGISASETNWMT